MTIHSSAKKLQPICRDLWNAKFEPKHPMYCLQNSPNQLQLPADVQVLTSTLGDTQGYKFLLLYPFYAFAEPYEMSVSFYLSFIHFPSRVSPSKNTFNREP